MLDTTVRTSWGPSLAGGAVMALALAVLPPAPIAGAASCEVWNATTGGSPSSDLQQTIDTASARDVLEVQGVCVGGFVVDKHLNIRNRSGHQAVLDANLLAPAITATGMAERHTRLTLTGLTLRDGRGAGGGISARFVDLRIRNSVIRDSRGGGIRALRSRTHLVSTTVRDNRGEGLLFSGSAAVQGASRIIGNVSSFGGGIFAKGDLRVSGSSLIGGNRAKAGGGIWIEGGRTLLEDRAHVTGNESYAWGGGGIAGGPVVMRNKASIRENAAPGSGGFDRGEGGGVNGNVSMFGRSSIVNNVAGSRGGGIYGDAILVSGQARIAGNQAPRGAGVFLEPRDTLRLEHSARIVDNVAGKRGGGVYVSVCAPYGTCTAHVAVKGSAVIARNRPDDIYRQRD